MSVTDHRTSVCVNMARERYSFDRNARFVAGHAVHTFAYRRCTTVKISEFSLDLSSPRTSLLLFLRCPYRHFPCSSAKQFLMR
jgi:hypothetical protein